MALDPDYFARLYIREKIKEISGCQGVNSEASGNCNPNKLLARISAENDQEKLTGHRLFVYYVSRIVIVYNPKTNKQRFYECHNDKITCICVHDLRFLVASSEASLAPKINVWDVVDFRTLCSINSMHKNGVISMSFSKT